MEKSNDYLLRHWTSDQIRVNSRSFINSFILFQSALFPGQASQSVLGILGMTTHSHSHLQWRKPENQNNNLHSRERRFAKLELRIEPLILEEWCCVIIYSSFVNMEKKLQKLDFISSLYKKQIKTDGTWALNKAKKNKKMTKDCACGSNL